MNDRPSKRFVGQITLANKEKNAGTTVTCFYSTNSTVHVSGLRFSLNLKVFTNSCFKFPKSSVLAFFKSKLWEILSEWQTSEVFFGSD